MTDLMFRDAQETAPIEFPLAEKPVMMDGQARSVASQVSLSASLRGQDPASSYDSTKNALIAGNTDALHSESYYAMEPSVRQQQEVALKLLSKPNLDKATYEDALRMYQSATGTGAVRDLPVINKSNFADMEVAELPSQEDVLAERAQMFADDMEAASSIETMLNAFAAKGDVDTASNLMDVTGALTLPENTAYSNQVKTYLEERGWAVESDWVDIISPGGAVQDIVKYGNSLPLEAKKAFFQDVIDGLSQANGVVGDPNHFAALAVARSIGEHMMEGSEYAWYEKLADNLEVAGLVPLVSSAVKGGVRVGRSVFTKNSISAATSLHPNTAVSTVAAAAPNTSGNLIAKAIVDPTVADMAGTNPTEILMGLGVPKYQAADLVAAPANIMDEVNKIQIYGDELVNKTLYNGFLLNNADENDAIAAALNEAHVLANKQPSMHVHNQLLVAREESGFVWQNIFGNGNVGYLKQSEALDAARVAGMDVESGAFEIVKFNPKSNSFTSVYNGSRDAKKSYADVAGEFYIRTTEATRYDPSFLTPLVSADIPKQGKIYTALAGMANNFQLFKSVEAILSREMAKKVTASFTARVALKDNLDRLTATYTTLSDTGKAKVMRTVEEGANWQDAAGNVVGKEFSYTELAGKGLDEDEIVAYFQVKEVAKVSHAVRNRKMYETLKEQGWHRVVDESADFDNVARNVDSVDVAKARGLKEVYDPYTKGIRKVSDEILDFLYGQGGRLVELKQPMRVGNKKLKHAFVKDKSLTTRELPKQVLNQVDGYRFPRIYDENYFIVAKNNDLTVDGLKAGELDKTTVVHSAITRQEAESLLNKLRAGQGNTEYSVKLGRELVGKADEFELEAASGGLYYSRRGNPLVGDNNRAARIVDPIRAMDINKNNIAKVAVTEDMVNQMERLWTSTFGQKYSKQGFPLNRSDIINPGGLAGEEFNKAQAMWDLIDSYKRVGEPDKLYREIMLSVAQTLDNARLGKVGAMLANPFYTSAKRGSSPLSRLKSAAFTLSIAMRPMRQLYLQAAQHGYLGAVDFGSLTNSYRQLSGISYAVSAEALGRGDGFIQGAKLAGMNSRDFRVLVEAFKESGLSRQVDTHQMTSSTLKDPQASLWDGKNVRYRLDKAIDTLVRKPINIGRTAGFDTGERYNQLMTFLFAYNKLSKQAGKALDLTNKKTLDNVVGETNLLTFNMTGAGELGIQNGFLRNTAQFMTFQIKSLQNILGSTRTFTKEERLRIAGVTLALWGAGGFGLRQMWEGLKLEHGLELPPEVDEGIGGGLAEMALNKAATELFQDDEDMAARIDFAGNTSPFSGVMFWEMVNWDQPVYSAALGASAHTGKKLLDVMEYGGNLFFHNPSMETTEKLGAFANRASEVVPLVSDTGKYYVAQKTGWLMDSHGDPKVRVSAAEAYSLLLGMYPTRAAQLNLFTRTAKEKSDDLQKDAQAMVDMMTKYKDLDENSLEAAREEIETFSAILSTYPEGDRDILRMHMYKALSLKSRKEQGDITLFWNRLARKTGSASEETRRYIEQAQLPEAVKKQVVEAHESLEEK